MATSFAQSAHSANGSVERLPAETGFLLLQAGLKIFGVMAQEKIFERLSQLRGAIGPYITHFAIGHQFGQATDIGYQHRLFKVIGHLVTPLWVASRYVCATKSATAK